MKKNRIATVIAAAFLITAVTACGGASYADGEYEGQSSIYEGEDDGNGAGYGVVKITITGGAVTACEYHTYEPDGTLKDEDYGKQNGEVANKDFYNKAQRAVKACEKYAAQYAQSGSLKDVDAISGATISYNEFEEAVKDALSKAKQ